MEPRIIVLIAFVVITILTALAVLASAIGWFPDASPKLVTWGIPGVLGEIVLTMIMFFKGQWSNKKLVTINLSFDGIDSFDIDFDISKCTYTVIESSGHEVNTGNIAPILGHGGWQIKLPTNVDPDNSVSLSLVTVAGEKWKIRPFLPLVHTQNVIKQS